MEQDVRNELDVLGGKLRDVWGRLVALDGPGGVVGQMRSNHEALDRRVSNIAVSDYNRISNLRNCLIGVGVVVIVLSVYGWFLRGRTEGRIAAVRGEVATVVRGVASVRGDLGAVTRRVDRAEDHLASLERRVIGVRRFVRDTAGLTGALEDTQGVDHNRKLFRISGFAPCRLDGETLVTPVLSAAMKREMLKVVALFNTGWTVKDVLGFADETSFRRNGEILENSGALNAACAEARAKILASHIGLSDAVPTRGRGTTTKFGGLDVNRSVLIYLERSVS